MRLMSTVAISIPGEDHHVFALFDEFLTEG